MNGQEISALQLESFRERWAEDRQGHMVSDALARNTLEEVALARDAASRLPFTFTIDMDSDGVCDQAASERCWSFTYLNIARVNVKKTLGIAERNFQMSHAFVYFYDQLEKSNQFMNRVLRTADRPLTDRVVDRLLSRPISDYGYFGFVPLAKKYGLVPKAVMPDSQIVWATMPMTRILSMKLRRSAKELRDAFAAGASASDLEAMKTAILADVYGILCRFLGEPPQTFDFEYTDVKGVHHRLEGQTPLQFMDDYCGLQLEHMVEVNHWPDSRYKYNEMYYRTDFPEDGPQYDSWIALNASMEDIRDVAVKMLEHGEPVIFGSDPRMFASKKYGLMDQGLFDLESLFGTGLMMEKPYSHDYKWTVGTHMMLINGVNIGPDGKPDRWKVQNSYGQSMGINGHYVMSDRWFMMFCDGATLDRRFMNEEMLRALEKEPIAITD